jgi:hypothetical protein
MEPTPEQIAGWLRETASMYEVQMDPQNINLRAREVARLAYAAGADAELNACCDYVVEVAIWGAPHWGSDLRYKRRPKPPSLKQQALDRLGSGCFPCTESIDLIREALESLPDD